MLDGLLVDRYVTYATTFLQPVMTDRLTGQVVAPGDRPNGRFVGNPMFDLLGARYLVSASPLPGSAGPGAPLQLISKTDTSLVYENTSALPRAWIVTTLHPVVGESAALAFFEGVGHRDSGNALEVTGFDPRSEAVIEVGQGTLPTELQGLVDGAAVCSSSVPADVIIDEYETDRVVIDVSTDCAGLLVLSDTWYPGWRVSVNDERRRSYATNLAFRGVAVPAGASRVVFRYEPVWWRVGWFISLLSIATLVGWSLMSRRRGSGDRRATPEPPPHQ